MTPLSPGQRSIQRRLFVAVALPIMLLTLLATSFLGLIAYLRATAGAVERADIVLAQATRAMTLVVDQETGLRGYLLTNDLNFLAPYERAAPQTEATLGKLDSLVAEDTIQRQRLGVVRQELRVWQAYASASLAAKRANTNLDLNAHRDGKRHMDAMRANLAAFMASETTLRADRNTRVAGATNVVVIVSLLGSMLFGVALALSAHRQIISVSQEYSEALTASNIQASELQASSARFEALFDHAPLGILLSRGDVVVAANHAFVELFGYTAAAEVLGKSRSSFLIPDDELGYQGASEHTAADDTGTELLGVRADGTTFPLRMHTAQIQLGDGVAQVAYLTDQTTQRQLEQQVLRMQKLESVGRLAGGIAHDFNNLLTVITSAVDLAEETLSTNRTALADLMLIRQTVDRGSALTRQLLAVASRQPSHPTTFNLNQLINDLQPLLHLLLGSQIDLQLIMASVLWYIEADPGQIEQVLLNFVVNARDAMPHGGTLMIETANVVLEGPVAQRDVRIEPGRYVCFAVRDTGSGMTADVKERLFEPFFTTKGPEQGTGLGLATSYGIITQHRGHISVRSELGRGTSFEVYLPPATSADEALALGE